MKILFRIAPVLLVALAPACGQGEKKSTQTTQTTQTIQTPLTPTPTLAKITALRVTGPANIAVGATVQYAAVVDRADGSTEDVTTSATWSTSAAPPASIANVLRLTGKGTAEALSSGEAYVHVDLAGSGIIDGAFLIVLSLTPGTFRVSGNITFGGEPAVAATVEIVSGMGTGRRMTTSSFGSPGRYALYGAAGDVDLRVTANGFEPQVHHLNVADQLTDDFVLGLSAAPADLSGAWTATFTASPSCRTGLPAAAVDREFNLDITQVSTLAHLAFSSATMSATACCATRTPLRVDGRVLGQSLTFDLDHETSDFGTEVYPDLLERLTNPVLWIGRYGHVAALVTGSEVTGTLDGQFAFSSVTSTGGQPVLSTAAVCHAGDGPVTLRRK